MKFVHPETLQLVNAKDLPEAYRERLAYVEKKLTKKDAKKINITEDNNLMYQTPAGHRLATAFRKPAAGGGDILLNTKFKEDKPWETFYAKQFVTIKKKTSHVVGETKTVLIYTEEYAKVHGTIKFEKVRKFINELEEVREAYEKDMKSKDLRTFMLATMVAMSDESPFRAGGSEAALRKKNKTYGMTTLLRKHFEKEGNVYKIAFPGKGGVIIRKTIGNPKTVANLDSILKKRRPNDWAFHINGTRISEEDLNGYVKSLTNVSGITFHKFRHVHASRMFKEAIDKYIKNGDMPDMPTQAEVSKLVKKAGAEAASLLGNEKEASLGSYIIPQLIFDVYKKYGVEVPSIYKDLIYDKLPSKVDIKKIEEEEEVDSSAENTPEGYNYDKEVEKQEDFEIYILEYKHDDKDIVVKTEDINKDTKTESAFLYPDNFVPDFSNIKSINLKDAATRPTNKQPTLPRDLADRFGYNDSPLDKDRVRERMEDRALQDITRLTKED